LPEIGVSAGILVGMRKGFIRQGGRLKNSSGECLTEASDGPRRGGGGHTEDCRGARAERTWSEFPGTRGTRRTLSPRSRVVSMARRTDAGLDCTDAGGGVDAI
jgi:hypothetical protein